MLDNTPLVRPEDRFPIGLPGHTIPVSAEPPSGVARPWGMDRAATLPMTKHEKPTGTRKETVKTQVSDDGKVRSDDYTQTVTD